MLQFCMSSNMENFLVVLLLSTAAAVLGGVLDNRIDDVGKEKHWALIVAGSSGWYNYRHQADICHAYHIMRNHGIPAERIVTMMFDDIARNSLNPTPGIIINHPNGPDVYGGVVIDYRKEDVSAENFLKILQGDEEAMKGIGSGKVIKSGPNDHVFVNFADHGAPGLVAFPRTMLHARDLNQAIVNMHNKQQYKQMVFYIEACESGSMFERLLADNIGVFATTAANPRESSYACYMDYRRNTYLGDVYSVKWMEDSDVENLKTETLQLQYKIVKKETHTSHVQEYGDMAISKEPVADFQGKQGAYHHPAVQRLPKAPLNAVASEEVPLAILHHRLEKVKDMDEELAIVSEIQDIIKTRAAIETSMHVITNWATGDVVLANQLLKIRHDLKNFDCYEPVVEHYHKTCFDLTQYDFALRRLYILVNLCEEMIATDVIKLSIDHACA